ncbi:GNAT family N-acetyltransferase [Kribbella italica]|uniref:GNAT superfamily N-acetyltransferase n=1 Tax=Kribbella italica TaxID=1540520 RepID=A0A7W9JET0_9ACTN|nr:GNAT superfamily N-acetyltransferase [Kribbella italica]
MERYEGDVVGIADELTEAYVEVFTAPPWEQRDPAETRTAFRQRLDGDATRDGFGAWIERAEDGRIAGFVTGWVTPAPFRTDRSYGQVLERLGAEQVRESLVGAFEIDELGVLDRARGTGLGKRLLSTAADHQPSGAWLLTWNQAHDTIAFYRRIGWHEAPVKGQETDIVVFLSPNHPNV